MIGRRLVATLVGGLAIAGVGIGGVQIAMNPAADFADLVPAPNAIVWQKGDMVTLWLSTNRHDVDVHIDSVALGLGEIDRSLPGTGETQPLGEGLGCREWLVSALSATVDSSGVVEITIDILRNGFTGDAEINMRYSHSDGTLQATTSTLSGSATQQVLTLNLPHLADGLWTIEASSDEHFPEAITRTITAHTETRVATADIDVETLLLLENTGVALEACSEHEDVLITLTGDKGVVLNRYLVDVLPAREVNRPPAWDEGDYALRAVCGDQGGDRALLFDGLPAPGELVGDALAVSDPDGDPMTVSLAAEGDYAYFAVDEVSGDYQLRLSELGPNDDTGLDVERLYALRLLARDNRGGRDAITVTVQVDETRLGTGTDDDASGVVDNDERSGICP